MSRPGHVVEKVFAFTYILEGAADSSDFQTYEGKKFTSSSGSDSVYVPAITKEDTYPEPNETFKIGLWDDNTWYGCVITIVDDEPEIASVEITSRPARGFYYEFGENVDVTVTLDQEVEVEGTPLLSLYIGEGDGSHWRGAKYHSGSGSHALVFRYKIQASDSDHNGLSVGAGATADDRTPAYGFNGNIYAKGTKAPIDYCHGGISDARSHLVEGRPIAHNSQIVSAPPDGWLAYRANQIIEAAFGFNADVEVQGNVYVYLVVGYEDGNRDESLREAQYLRGSGSDTLVFGYTVRPGDADRKGVIIAAAVLEEGFKGGGKVLAKGTDYDVFPYFLGRKHDPNHKVDTAIPNISSVTIESRPGSGDAFTAGETISVAVTFSEKVTLTGDPYIELDVGGVARQAALRSENPRSASAQDRQFGDRLVFQYQVAEGETDSDGIGISANSLKLNGGGIYDKAGNAADLSHGTLPAESGQKVGAST